MMENEFATITARLFVPCSDCGRTIAAKVLKKPTEREKRVRCGGCGNTEHVYYSDVRGSPA
jgi:ribosomal protein S27E